MLRWLYIIMDKFFNLEQNILAVRKMVSANIDQSHTFQVAPLNPALLAKNLLYNEPIYSNNVCATFYPKYVTLFDVYSIVMFLSNKEISIFIKLMSWWYENYIIQNAVANEWNPKLWLWISDCFSVIKTMTTTKRVNCWCLYFIQIMKKHSCASKFNVDNKKH